jgi:hypothetical protein
MDTPSGTSSRTASTRSRASARIASMCTCNRSDRRVLLLFTCTVQPPVWRMRRCVAFRKQVRAIRMNRAPTVLARLLRVYPSTASATSSFRLPVVPLGTPDSTPVAHPSTTYKRLFTSSLPRLRAPRNRDRLGWLGRLQREQQWGAIAGSGQRHSPSSPCTMPGKRPGATVRELTEPGEVQSRPKDRIDHLPEAEPPAVLHAVNFCVRIAVRAVRFHRHRPVRVGIRPAPRRSGRCAPRRRR